MLETLQDLLRSYKKTCSISKIKDGCVTFLRHEKYLYHLERFYDKDAIIFSPVDSSLCSLPSDTKLRMIHCGFPEYEFTLFHNKLYKDNIYPESIIGNDCNIHKTAILDADGLKVVNAPNGSKVQFKHTGNVVIGDNVNIGPYSVIHKGTMDSTIIRDGCNFGAYTNIGHNCNIGKNVTMAAGVILSGGVHVGDNVWFGSGSIIRHHLYITDDVVIGTGAVVVKDILKSGIYVGNPARYLKPITKGWNF